MPTETVYGLAGNAYSDISVKKIFSLKSLDPKIKKMLSHKKSLNILKRTNALL